MGKRDWYIKLRQGGTKKNPSSGRVVGTRGPYKSKTNALSAGKRLINGYELPTGVKLVVEQGDVGVPKAPAAKKANPKTGHWYGIIRHESGTGKLKRFYLGANKAAVSRWIKRTRGMDDTWLMGKVDAYYSDIGGREISDPWFSNLPPKDKQALAKALGMTPNPKRNPPDGAPYTKTFDRKKYHYHSSMMNKAMADVVAERIRDEDGDYARVVKVKAKHYAIYYRKRGLTFKQQVDADILGYHTAKVTSRPTHGNPRRKNTHLTVGANVKLSAKGIQQKHRHGTEQPPVMPSQMAPEDWRGVVAEVWDEGGGQGYTVEDRRGRRDYMADHLLVAADSTTRKFPGTGYRGETPRRSNPFSPYFKVGTTVSGTPVYTERLTVAELKKKSPESKGPLHAREMSDVHLAAAKQSFGALSHYHFAMASAFDNLHSIYQYGIWDAPWKVGSRRQYDEDKEWRQANIVDELKKARAALDEHYALHADNQILRLHYTAEVTPERVRAAGKRWDRLNNPTKWVQGVDKEMEERGTVGAFTKQARRAGYSDTMEYARKVMAGWRSGKKTVLNKKTRRQQKITQKTMYRANFAINVQKRNPSHRKNTPLLSQTPHPQRNPTDRTDVIRTGIFNELNDEIVVFPGGSDFGTQGWFVGEESNYPAETGRRDKLFTHTFFEGLTEDSRKRALRAATEYAGFAGFKKRGHLRNPSQKRNPSMAKHIGALKKLFPGSRKIDTTESGGWGSGGIWTSFGEEGIANSGRMGWPDEFDPKLQAYMDKNDLWGEWYDSGTLMIYRLNPSRKRNAYFPKPAYAAKKRRQYKMNPRKNASPYRAMVKREMPRLRRQGHSPTDAMKIIGTMWKRRMKR